MKPLSIFLTIVIVCCLQFMIFAATGFANNVTGGAGGTVVTVTTAANFKSYTESTSTYIIQVSGTIDLGSVGGGVRICSNKTIKGIDANAKIIGRLGFRDDQTNVIIERLTITNPSYSEADGIQLRDRVTNVFINKCTIYDCGDGGIDITNESDFITVSWCKFYYTHDLGHNFVNLIGSGDEEYDDRGKLRVTFHHNWWGHMCKERMPRVRFGKVHVYNNYYSNLLSGGYCIGVGVESEIRIESNYFNSVPIAWKNYSGTPFTGKVGWDSGNIFDNCVISIWAPNNYSTIFIPPYSYNLSNASDIPYLVESYAGAQTPYPPHWIDYLYGDFTRSGTVGVEDLSEFAEYWLSDSTEADRDDDGNVDFYEFSLLAQNWGL